MIRTISIAIAFAVTIAAVPVIARADQAADDAAKLTEEAGDAYQKGDFATCRTKATEAWSKFQHAQIAGLLGSCEVKLGMFAEGATHLDFYLKSSTADVNPEAKQLLEEARQRTSEVTLACHPDGVVFKVDGKPLGGTGGQTVFLDPGSHVISAEKEGFEPKQAPQTIAAGTKVTVNIELEQKKEGGPDKKLPMWPGEIGIAAGAVSIGIGIGLVGAANGKDNDAAAKGKGLSCDPAHLSTACGDVQSIIDSRDKLSNGAIGAFVIGGAFAAAGAIWIPLALSSGKSSAEVKAAFIPRVVPVVSKNFGGIVIQGEL